MTNENCFLKIVCGTSLLLINTVVLANSSQVTTDSITSNNSNVGQTAPFHLAQLGPNKSDVVTSTRGDNNKDTLRDNSTEEAQNKLREEVPMMMPATPTTPAAPHQSNRLNLNNNTTPANSQQRLLNPGRPVDSGY